MMWLFFNYTIACNYMAHNGLISGQNKLFYDKTGCLDLIQNMTHMTQVRHF